MGSRRSGVVCVEGGTRRLAWTVSLGASPVVDVIVRVISLALTIRLIVGTKLVKKGDKLRGLGGGGGLRVGRGRLRNGFQSLEVGGSVFARASYHG